MTGGPGSDDEEAVGIDPLTAPLTYPGVPPWRPAVLVTDTGVLTLQPVREAPLGEWMVRPEPRPADPAESVSGPDRPLDSRLREEGHRPAADRTPVLAVGSNASPAQLRRKMASAGLPTQIPVTAVSVRGLTVGVSAHVSRPGYLPATPVPDPASESQLWVLWLDAVTLDAVDATEPTSHRIRLSARCPVRLTSGPPVTGSWVYLSRHGHLLNASGRPRRLTDQATLIAALLTELPALQALAGTDPQQWIERTRDPSVRTAIREMFRAAGLVGSADRF